MAFPGYMWVFSAKIWVTFLKLHIGLTINSNEEQEDPKTLGGT